MPSSILGHVTMSTFIAMDLTHGNLNDRLESVAIITK